MKDFRTFELNAVVGGVAALMLLTTDSTLGSGQTQSTWVRKLDYTEAPQMKMLAEDARRIGNQLYPSVCALLTDAKGEAPRYFDICVKKQLLNGNSGMTRLNQVCLNATYLDQWKDDPGAFASVVLHEMAHVAQHYEHPVIGRWLFYHHNAPSWLQEGIADYVSFKLGETNGWRCAECSAVFPHYLDGYSCAGAFLMFLEKTYDHGIVRKLNAKLRHGGFSDDSFVKLTGKNLQTLWREFRNTAAFSPSAARMLDLQQSLGFVAGKPPKDIEARLKTFIDCSVDERVKELMTQAHMPGLSGGNVQGRLVILCYFTQAGGTAEAFITGLKKRDELPGFLKGEHGTLTGAISSRDLTPHYPVTRSFSATKVDDDASTYHYSVFRPSQDGVWSLQRAWRTTADEQGLKEWLIP